MTFKQQGCQLNNHYKVENNREHNGQNTIHNPTLVGIIGLVSTVFFVRGIIQSVLTFVQKLKGLI